ncbi:pyocin knob domain-containing protein (plasmid) [Bacillus velezensis]|uniref:pyocin knob domain-containing protein n=1 Tax=Bacillus velezensis TaxID=492670 RepID=UPI0020254293|nr:pyocin knob domain-containing protein [Bacillus velezensis]URJ76428.1 pyocin knob domain-containing protein [Bacillus velezensis]URJ80384.1 pyocin knob domain-containing protein [Bacillus velezensis]
MTIQKVRHHFHDGTEFKTLHYETQASQVAVLDSNGETYSNLDEVLMKGKLIDSVDLNEIKTTGVYRVKNGLNSPEGMSRDMVYMMFVIAIEAEDDSLIVRQEFYDHINLNLHERSINGSMANPWLNAGKSTLDRITSAEEEIRNIHKEILDIKSDVKENEDGINQNKGEIQRVDKKLDSHDHDNRYLKLSGGNLTGETSIQNNTSFSGKNTSGANLSLAKVNGSNQVVLGDGGAKLLLDADVGDVSIRNQVGDTFPIFHMGNMGSGSRLDADKLDGIEGSQYARLDKESYYQENIRVESGKSVFIKAPSGVSRPGGLYFRAGDDTPRGRIRPTEDGDIELAAGEDNVLGLTVLRSGDTQTWHDHILNAKDRQVALRFKLNDKDKGAGFYMNNGSKQVGFYDWEYGGRLFSSDREDQMVKFDNAIKIQNHQVSIQSSAPSGASNGDIWFKI